MPLLSFPPTEPIQGQNSGSVWNVESQQYPHHTQGFAEACQFWPTSQENQVNRPRGRDSLSETTHSQWSDNIVGTKFESQDMSPIPSQDSLGAQSQQATHSSVTPYDQDRSRMYPQPSHGSFHMSSAKSDVTGRSTSPENAALYTSTQLDIQDYDTYLGNDLTGSQNIFHGNSTSGADQHMINASVSGPFTNIYPTAGDELLVSSYPISMASQGPVVSESLIYSQNVIAGSDLQWDSTAVDDFLGSPTSPPISPISPISPDETWSAANMMVSSANSPPTYEAISPRYVQDPELVELPPYETGDRVTRKPMGPRHSKVVGDLAAAHSRQQQVLGTSDVTDDSLKLTSRSGLDDNNVARLHPLYQNVKPGPDGFYHCPWEGKSSCQHKAEKLKCNYEYEISNSFISNNVILILKYSKFVDSHLKPYRCKVIACENLNFSSTACLLRHEREAHAMHGHGNKPFLCSYKECDRATANNGFPRHWNLRDHMRRVHNDGGSVSPPPPGHSRGKKRKNDEKPENQPTEKATKKVNTPAVVHQPQGPTQEELYQQEYQRLVTLMEQIRDPKDAHNLEYLQSTMDSLRSLHRTSSLISGGHYSRQQALAQQSG
jgi:hypothetical protein